MEELIREFTEVLEDNNHGTGSKGINKLFSTWEENKKQLIELLSKHPQWNPEKFMIQFDTNVEREIDISIVSQFFRKIDNIKSLPSIVNNFFTYYTEKTISSFIASEINKKFPELKLREGQKTTKVIKKICEYFDYPKACGTYTDTRGRTKSLFEKLYAEYADAMSPLMIKRHTVISLNPVDYILSSNGNSWSSCHTIINGSDDYNGCHRSGTLSYMMDPSTIVFYQVDASYSGDKIELEPKIIRQMFHYQDGVLVQGRLYPQCNDGKDSLYVPNRAIMQKVIADCLDVPNLWKKKGGITVCSNFVKSEESYAHYPDYVYNSECNVSRILDLCPEGEDNRLVHVGHVPYCINCGDPIDEGGTLYCPDTMCQAKEGDYIKYCAACGCEIDEDSCIQIDGEYYCEDCVTYCEDCESYHTNDDIVYINELDRYVCNSCYENNYSRCEHCDEVYANDSLTKTADGNYVCPTCLEYYYTEIEGEFYRNEDVRYCKNCGQAFIGEDDFCSEECAKEYEGEKE